MELEESYPLKQTLKKNNYQEDLNYPAVGPYSATKLQHYVDCPKKFEEIYDLYAIRIVVDKIEECYLALGVIHNIYPPIQDRFKDFIATPKTNGYQSIHTTIIGTDGKMVEIQIRTSTMNETAEIGIASHWIYKEGKKKVNDISSDIKWLRELIEILKNLYILHPILALKSEE